MKMIRRKYSDTINLWSDIQALVDIGHTIITIVPNTIDYIQITSYYIFYTS